MTRKCFFVDCVDPGESCITLKNQTAHHMESVLRLKAGESIELRDGQGNAWRAVIATVESDEIGIRLDGLDQLENESPLEITLAMAFARSDRMDLVLRQATEMGINRFSAFRARRSQYGLSGSQAEKRKERWQKIAKEALCQCRRTRLPEIRIAESIEEFIAELDRGSESGNDMLKVLASEGERDQSLFSLWKLFPESRRIVAVIGPEGGWTEIEAAQFMEAGFKPVHIGPRVLRLETAAISILASAQLLWGDFR
ncbi:MAG: 16S rRNA (uracil(1498)-N(3))-methyltransferase [Syntrophobacteraceae bacterium]